MSTKREMALAYVTSVWSESEKERRKQLLENCGKVMASGYIPICPEKAFDGLFDEDDPDAMAKKKAYARTLLSRCRMVIVCGTARDEQVSDDIQYAVSHNIPVTTLDGIVSVRTAV